MRQRSAKSRAGSMTAAAVLAAVGLGSAAQATFVIDLRLSDGSKASTVSSGSVVSLNVYGQVTGSASSAVGLQDAFFGITNTGGAGDLSTVTLNAPWTGVATDVAGVTTSNAGTLYGSAGSKSVGSTNSDSPTGWVFARSTSMTTTGGTSIAAGAGQEFLLGTLSFTAGSTGASTLHVNTRTAGNSNTNTLIVPALWKEDTGVKDGSGGSVFSSGTDVTISIAAGGLPGDLNGDHIVDGGDINYVTARWLNSGTPGSLDGDANGDGVVDGGDINYITARWLNTGEPGGIALAPAFSAVPEPASLSLLGLGAVGLLARRRK